MPHCAAWRRQWSFCGQCGWEGRGSAFLRNDFASCNSLLSQLKKLKAKLSQASGPSSPLQSPINSTDSLNEQGINLSTPIEAGFSETLVCIQEALNQELDVLFNEAREILEKLA